MPRISVVERARMLFLSNWLMDERYNDKILDSIEQLRELFPADEKYSDVFFRKCKDSDDLPQPIITKVGKLYPVPVGYDVYFRLKKYSNTPENIAYGCPICEKIIVGPPKIGIEDSIKNGVPLSGRRALRFYCKNCSVCLDEDILMIS